MEMSIANIAPIDTEDLIGESCDKCNTEASKAKWVVVFLNGIILFCNSHFKKNEGALRKQAIWVQQFNTNEDA